MLHLLMFYAQGYILFAMPNSSPLRNRVKELRERLNIRQSELANEVGITRQTIIAIEKGRLNPSILICLKIAKLLREPVDYIFYLEPGFDYTQHAAELANRPKRGRKKRNPNPAAVSSENAAAERKPEELPAARDTFERDAAANDHDGEDPETGSVTTHDAEPRYATPQPVAVDSGALDAAVRGDGQHGDQKSGQAIWDFF